MKPKLFQIFNLVLSSPAVYTPSVMCLDICDTYQGFAGLESGCRMMSMVNGYKFFINEYDYERTIKPASDIFCEE